MTDYLKIFENNKAWVAQQKEKDIHFFDKLSRDQQPDYLYIGCSDSRVPANEIMGLKPGELFVHRNIANMIISTDMNVMSVLQFAIEVLEVKHIIVCGHYDCGGIQAAMEPKDMGLLNSWLRNIRDVYRFYEKELDAIEDEHQRTNRLVELNVIEQCRSVIKTSIFQQSYLKNKIPMVHGWVFDMHNGLLKDLDIDFERMLLRIQKLYNLTGIK